MPDPQAVVNVSPLPKLLPMVVSAPFGNYIQPDGATATLGTFTAEARGGRVRQIIRTVRYYPRLRAWVNKIGLRNPGIQWLVDRVKDGRKKVGDQIVSVHGFYDNEWSVLLDRCTQINPGAVELNMSCPNVGNIDWPEDLFQRAVATGLPVIVKLPPVNYQQMAEMAAEAGVRSFHCCNTLPIPAGGLSGKPLKPIALQCIRELKSSPWAQGVQFIGGGGIANTQDIDEYVATGVDAVALGTKTMNPWLMVSHGPIRPLIEHAHKALNCTGGA